MEGQLYIRVRGRVLGPYERDKLREQVRRGQLSRMHEVSEDGVTWNRASSYADLFQSSASDAAVAANPAATNGDSSSVGSNGSARPIMPPQPAQPGTALPVLGVANSVAQPLPSALPAGMPVGGTPAWYYTRGDQEYGPVDFSQLQQAVSLGNVGADDQVWTNGMADWVSPTQVRGLSVRTTSPSRAPAVNTGGSEANADIPTGVLWSLSASRGWVLFIAICMYLSAFASGFWGIFLMFSGSGKLGGEGAIFTGLVILVQAIVSGLTGLFLSMYYGRIGEVMSTRKAFHLERALKALNAYWILISTVLIVSILGVVMMVVLMMFTVAALK